jgi:hypothetical protein
MSMSVEVKQQPDGTWAVVIDGTVYGVSKARHVADFAANVIRKHGMAGYEHWLSKG